MPSSFSAAGSSDASTARKRAMSCAPVLDEDRPQDVVLRREVVVEEAVRDARVLRDVADARSVVAVLREHADRGVEDALALVRRAIERSVNAREDRGTLRPRATARRHARRRLHALPAGRVREPRA